MYACSRGGGPGADGRAELERLEQTMEEKHAAIREEQEKTGSFPYCMNERIGLIDDFNRRAWLRARIALAPLMFRYLAGREIEP